MDSDQGKLFIGGFSWETSEEMLKDYFDNYDEVVLTSVMRDKLTGRPRELLRENKRMMDKSIREIEIERQGLQNQEKKLIVEIKKSAKQGQMGCTYDGYLVIVTNSKEWMHVAISPPMAGLSSSVPTSSNPVED